MELYEALGSRAGVQAVHVLRGEEKVASASADHMLQLCYRDVAGVWLDIFHHRPPMRVPALNEQGVAEEGFDVGEFLGPKLLPESTRIAKRGNAAFG